MIIRVATIKDVEEITENNVLLAQESEKIELNYDKVLNGVKTVIEDKVKGFFIVAIEEDRVIGQLMITYEWSDWRNKDIWWLQSMYVKKKFRRKGIMKAMVQEIKKSAVKKNVCELRLYVHTGNKGAVKAYEKVEMKKAPYLMYQMILSH